MTTQELNRDIKRLCKRFNEGEYSESFDKEFKRLYNADSNFQYIKPQLALNMIRINSARRIYALHTFGIGYQIKL